MNILIKDIDLSNDNTIYIKKIDGKYYARHSHVMGFSSEVIPINNGHWKLAKDGWYCSVCELYPPFDCDPEEKGIAYCPWCGASMSKEGEDE